MTVSSATSASSASAAAAATSSSSAASTLSSTSFLSLLVSELQNQDPLDATSTTDFVNQLSSYANFTEQQAINSSMTSLANSFTVCFLSMGADGSASILTCNTGAESKTHRAVVSGVFPNV